MDKLPTCMLIFLGIMAELVMEREPVNSVVKFLASEQLTDIGGGQWCWERMPVL